MAHPTKPNLFISASLDNTIKVWCLDVRIYFYYQSQKLVELYNFDLDSGELSNGGGIVSCAIGGENTAPCAGGGGAGK